jgi:hypothetical protein
VCDMTSRPTTRAILATAVLPIAAAIALGLSACAPEPATDAASGSTGSTPAASSTSHSTRTPTPTTTAVAMPTDCRALLSPAVLDALKDTPLNDPAFAPNGTQPDGSLVCVWGDPRADTTRLSTTISRMNRGPALDMLNKLVAEQGFTCYTPDAGTRCEKTWQDPTYPVTDGRTLFWRDGILIDTTYSNLSPSGYTSSVVAHVFA